MAAEAVINVPFVFQALFLDELLAPIAVNNPVVDIFHFTAGQARVDLVAAGVMNAAVPAETGRYTYAYTLPVSLSDGDTLYAEYRGTADDGTAMFVPQTINVIAPTRATGGSGSSGSSGLRAQFVKGG